MSQTVFYCQNLGVKMCTNIKQNIGDYMFHFFLEKTGVFTMGRIELCNSRYPFHTC